MKKNNYQEAWNKVADFESKGLPESELKEVDAIYAMAKQENNSGQLVKAIIYQMKLTDYKEENAFVKNLVKIKKEAEVSSFPAKPLLYSMLADMYWQYYQNNRWKFSQRSETAEFKNDDIETWSLERIVQETIHCYQTSLQEVDKLKSLSVQEYNEVLYKGDKEGRVLRPSIYDFLCHRAIDFYMSEEPSIIKPAYFFTLNEEVYMAEAATFVKLEIQTKDTLSMKYYALKHLQELTRFHLNDSAPNALAFIELKRLDFARKHLTLQTKNKLYEQALEQLVIKTASYPISSEVRYELARLYVEYGAGYVPLQSEKHKWDLKKAYEICLLAKEKFPDSRGAAKCEHLMHSLKNKSVSAVVEETNLPKQDFKVLVKYKNITTLHWRLIKTSREEVIAQRKKWERNYEVDREEKFLSYYTAKQAAKSGVVKLPDDGDMQMHATEIKLYGLSEGEYMVLFSGGGDFSLKENGLSYTFTAITAISFIHRNTADGNTDLYTLHRHSGESIGGVLVKLFYSEYNYKKSDYELKQLGTVQTDANGFVRIPYQYSKQSGYSRNLILELSKGEDRYSTSRIDGYHYDGALYQYQRGPEYTHTKVVYFLDRAIYRPGQTIYFKGLVLNQTGATSTLLTKYSTTVYLYDVNNQVAGEVDVTTNEFGTFSGSFTAPSKGLMGQMHLQTSHEDGQASFSVEEYKRPKFEAYFEPVKGVFRLGETVKAEGQAKAYSGAGIDGAKVQYRVVREARYPYWWWCRWGYYPSSPKIEITNGIAQTDEAGKFVVNFKAIPDPSVDSASDPTFIYSLIADVTDINGETHTATTTISVGYKALQLGTDILDIDVDKNDVWKKEYTITTTNLAGQHEPAKGKLVIYALQQPSRSYRSRYWERPDRQLYTKEEHEKLFPYDEYQEENNFLKWTRGKEILAHSFDTKDKALYSLASLRNATPGVYVVELTSADRYGQEVKEVVYFKIYSSKSKTFASNTICYLDLLTDMVEPGESATLLAGTGADKIKVLYEVEHDYKIVTQEWLVLQKEQKILSIPIKEEYRGNIAVYYTFILNNRFYHETMLVTVPYTNKELDIEFETFRDKLQPGQEEEWRLKIKGKKADQVMAEMVATLYDASLDSFRPHSWSAYFNMYRNANMPWSSVRGFASVNTNMYERDWNKGSNKYYHDPSYDQLEWFGYSFYEYYYAYSRMRGMADGEVLRSASMSDTGVERSLDSKSMKKLAAPAGAPMKEEAMESEADESAVMGEKAANSVGGKSKATPEGVVKTEEDFSQVKVRSNFNETAFFYPQLKTNEKGELLIKFTIPEALTRWKMMGFAHTKDLKTGMVSKQLVTQKELMVVPNQPRFFRENDRMVFSVKVTCLSDATLTGKAKLEFFDALTMKPLDKEIKNMNGTKDFSINAGKSTNLEWPIEIPEGVQAVLYRVVAKAGAFSDGEEMLLPVLTNRMLVTETLPLPIRGKQSKVYALDKMINTKSSTLRHHRYTLEFTSNPAWYAIQALPYLMEYPYECVEQTFSRYYANSIASSIANSNPRIKQVFDTWKNVQPDALLSNLEKNQELKSALLEETPWVLQAKDETQRKRSVALLFDLNRMGAEMERALDKVLKAQTSSGGFTWFPGFPEDRYMTQHIISGMGHLDVMGVKSVRDNQPTWNMVEKALSYTDRELEDDYRKLKAQAKKGYTKMEDNHLGYLQIHYLYMRSYFKDVAIASSNKEAVDYYIGQAKKYWLQNSLYMQGMLCLALHRFGDTSTPVAMIKSFKERALQSEEMGMYWKYESGYYWYQAPIETQALFIEVFDEVAKDTKSVDDLKVWLLKQKQTQDWKTTRATTEACYALLRRGSDFLASTQLVEIKVGDEVVDPSKRPDVKVEAGTGYFKTVWSEEAIKPEMGKITIHKKDEGVAWGAVYWQYFEQLDKITPAETPLKIKKELFVQQNTDRGPIITPLSDAKPLQLGDLIKVRIEIRVDRTMEYVHLKDMRASSFEPVVTLSTHRYQDGLYYYESPKDLAMNFFIGYLPKGTYVFEYPLRVSQKGDFSNGITTMQCMYAPEFASHSEGIRVQVK